MRFGIVYKESIPNIQVDWEIQRGPGVLEHFGRSSVYTFVVCRDNKIPVSNTIDDFGHIVFTLPMDMPAGVWGLRAIWTKDEQDVLGNANAFVKVMRSEIDNVLGVSHNINEATITSDIRVKAKSQIASYGLNGLSAYELAVMKGKTSLSENEWIEAQSGASMMYGRLQDQINELVAGGAEPSVSVSPAVVLVGNSTITVKGSVKKAATSLTLYKDSISGSVVANGSGVSVSGTSDVSPSQNGSILYYLKAVINGVSVNASASVKVEHPIYAGFGVALSDVAGVSGKRLSARSSASGSYSATASANGQKYYIVVPAYMSSLNNFSMGGAPFVMQNGTTEINGVSYKYYVSANSYNSGTKVTITAS